MKPFNLDGCCQSVCLSATESNLVSVFLCSSTTKSLSYWIQYSHSTHDTGGSQGRAPYLGNLYSYWTDRTGITVIKACQEMLQEHAPLQKLSGKSNSCQQDHGKHMRGTLQVLQPGTEDSAKIRKVRSCLEPPLSFTSFPCEMKHMGDWEYGAVLPIFRLCSLRKGKEQFMHLVSGCVQVNFKSHCIQPQGSSESPAQITPGIIQVIDFPWLKLKSVFWEAAAYTEEKPKRSN